MPYVGEAVGWAMDRMTVYSQTRVIRKGKTMRNPAELFGDSDKHAHERAPKWDRFLDRLRVFLLNVYIQCLCLMLHVGLYIPGTAP